MTASCRTTHTTVFSRTRGATVVVDEIQRLPSLLNEVHRFIEDQRMRFVLLGSSARKLKQAGTNLLAGRALHRQMFPLVPQELGRDFNLAEVAPPRKPAGDLGCPR